MAREWTIAGDYVEACNCSVACQCLWREPPDDDVCTVSFAWHIAEGRYGDVDLSGLHAGLLVRTEEGVILDPSVSWHFVLIVDEAADADQRAAMEDIFLGRAGGIFGVAAETHVETTEVTTAPFTFDRDGTDFAVRMGDIVSLEAHAKTGFNDEVGTVSPHFFTKSAEMSTGKSTTATVDYNDEFAWDVSENNAFLGDFELANA